MYEMATIKINESNEIPLNYFKSANSMQDRITMGSSYRYKCKSCHLAGDVSGGNEIGFFAEVHTALCMNCHQLADVFIGYWDKKVALTLDDKESMNRCPLCKSRDIKFWDEKAPCPNCGGEIENQGLVMDWD